MLGDLAGPATQSDVQLMGFWIRLAAALLDYTSLIGIGVLATAFIETELAQIVGFILILFVSPLYLVLFTALRGQTLGKIICRIQVVNDQGNAPGIGPAILREIILRFVFYFLFFVPYLWVGIDRHKRGLHDHLSGTYVIRKGHGW